MFRSEPPSSGEPWALEPALESDTKGLPGAVEFIERDGRLSLLIGRLSARPESPLEGAPRMFASEHRDLVICEPSVGCLGASLILVEDIDGAPQLVELTLEQSPASLGFPSVHDLELAGFGPATTSWRAPEDPKRRWLDLAAPGFVTHVERISGEGARCCVDAEMDGCQDIPKDEAKHCNAPGTGCVFRPGDDFVSFTPGARGGEACFRVRYRPRIGVFVMSGQSLSIGGSGASHLVLVEDLFRKEGDHGLE